MSNRHIIVNAGCVGIFQTQIQSHSLDPIRATQLTMSHRMSIKTLVYSTFVGCSSAIRLYSAHSDGNVSSLSFDGSDGAYTLEVTSRTAECKNNPAVLTLDKDRRVVYCYDRGASTDTIGSLTAFAISDTDGSLTPISRVQAPYGGVWAEILTAENGNRTYISSS